MLQLQSRMSCKHSMQSYIVETEAVRPVTVQQNLCEPLTAPKPSRLATVVKRASVAVAQALREMKRPCVVYSVERNASGQYC